MRVLFIQHDHVSPVGPVGERFVQRGYELLTMPVVTEENYNTPNVQVSFPAVGEFDVIVPMGSPWGAWDDATIGNWLLPELEFLKASHDAGTPILGLCFGGQMMARVLGGSVAKAPSHEIGYSYIFSDDESLIPNGPWFQWHYDRFVVPPRAVEIARNSKAPQAFVQGRTLGLQFHPELVSSMLAEWIREGGYDSLIRDGQDPELLMEHARREDPASTKRAHLIVDNFLDRIAPSEVVL
jgi:GMP synthase-like glutamine amidotransferase